ncbi:MAG: hypothetical protein ABII90_14810 [Bacteroidota bacterium]
MSKRNISIVALITNFFLINLLFAQVSDPKLTEKMPAKNPAEQPDNTGIREKEQNTQNKNLYINNSEAELLRAKEVYGDNSKMQKAELMKEKREQNINNNTQILPPGFPRYVDTGSPEDDQNKYAKAKEQWIHDNPEKYKELFNDNKVKTIPYKEFIKMPEEKQNQIKSNPDKYKIVKP